MDIAQKELLKRITKNSLYFLGSALFFGAIFYSITAFLGLTLYTVSGHSMEPTFKNHDYLLVKTQKELEDQNIVFFERPEAWDYAKTDLSHEPEILVKRVIAKPGDQLVWKGTAIFVNGKQVYDYSEDNYFCGRDNITYEHTLTSKEFFVFGDNANNSLDSRRVFCDGKKYFYISTDLIQKTGKVILTLG